MADERLEAGVGASGDLFGPPLGFGITALASSYKEFANALNLRERTVSWHLASIYSRLPVSSRSELEDKVKGADSWAKFLVHAETRGN